MCSERRLPDEGVTEVGEGAGGGGGIRECGGGGEDERKEQSTEKCSSSACPVLNQITPATPHVQIRLCCSGKSHPPCNVM